MMLLVSTVHYIYEENNVNDSSLYQLHHVQKHCVRHVFECAHLKCASQGKASSKHLEGYQKKRKKEKEKKEERRKKQYPGQHKPSSARHFKNYVLECEGVE
jgi:hypothetical protein